MIKSRLIWFFCPGLGWKQSLGQRPTGIEPSGKMSFANSQSLFPLTHSQAQAFVRKEAVGSLVALLLKLRGPSAIGGRVALLSVNSVEGMSCAGTRTHVEKKVLETLPSPANFDSAATVAGKVLVAWVVASPAHGVPAFVFGFFGQAMLDQPLNMFFAVQATARTAMGIEQGLLGDDLFFSTVTAAQPVAMTIAAVGFVQDQPASKRPTGDLNAVGWSVSHRGSVSQSL